MTNTALGVPFGLLILVGLSILLLIGCRISLQKQREYMNAVPEKFSKLTGKTWEYDTDTTSILSFPFLIFIVLLIIGSLVHGLTFEAFPLRKPYIPTVLSTYGVTLQLLISLLLWTPSIVLIAKGLTDAYRFSSKFRKELQKIDNKSNLMKDTQMIRGLLGDSLVWFFQKIQILLLLWGTVSGIGVALVFFARDEILVITTLSAAVTLLLAYLFIYPLLSLSFWVTERSSTIRSELQSQLTKTRMQTVADSVGKDKNNNTNKTISGTELENVIKALPPADTFQLFWRQSLQTLIALLAPFISVAIKLPILLR